MSGPPFTLLYAAEAQRVIRDLATKAQCADKLKKVRKALRLLQEMGPTYPGLNSHRYSSVKGPNGEEVWESYVENRPRRRGGSGGSTGHRRTPSRRDDRAASVGTRIPTPLLPDHRT